LVPFYFTFYSSRRVNRGHPVTVFEISNAFLSFSLYQGMILDSFYYSKTTRKMEKRKKTGGPILMGFDKLAPYLDEQVYGLHCSQQLYQTLLLVVVKGAFTRKSFQGSPTGTVAFKRTSITYLLRYLYYILMK
jgi:hypothetical protein